MELGFRGRGKIISREEFEQRKKILSSEATGADNGQSYLASTGCDVASSPILKALADREAAVASGKLYVSFVR